MSKSKTLHEINVDSSPVHTDMVIQRLVQGEVERTIILACMRLSTDDDRQLLLPANSSSSDAHTS